MQQAHHQPVAILQIRAFGLSVQAQQGVMVRTRVEQGGSHKKARRIPERSRIFLSLSRGVLLTTHRNLKNLSQFREQQLRLSQTHLVLARRMAVIQQRRTERWSG
jgi:hypothetical protein